MVKHNTHVQFNLPINCHVNFPQINQFFLLQDDLKDLENEGVIITGFAERLWAYLSIKDLLRKKLIAGDPKKSQLLYDEALKLALQYKLVTPVTSLIIKEADRPEYHNRKNYELHAAASPTMYSRGVTIIPGSALTFLCSLYVFISFEQIKI